MSQFTNLTAERASAVYQLLVQHAGAREDSSDEARFVQEYTRERPASEYRFKGALGMGGKFRCPRMTVDCYTVDETPARQAMIDATNAALAQFAKAQ